MNEKESLAQQTILYKEREGGASREALRRFADIVFQTFELSQGNQYLQDTLLARVLRSIPRPADFLEDFFSVCPSLNPVEINKEGAVFDAITHPIKQRLFHKVYHRFSSVVHPYIVEGERPQEAELRFRARKNLEQVLSALEQASERFFTATLEDIFLETLRQENLYSRSEDEINATTHDSADAKAIRLLLRERRIKRYRGSLLCYYILSPHKSQRIVHFRPELKLLVDELKSYILTHPHITRAILPIIEYYNNINEQFVAHDKREYLHFPELLLKDSAT